MNTSNDGPRGDPRTDSRLARARTLSLFAFLAVALAACASPGFDGSGWHVGGSQGDPATLQVENHHWNDMRIYAIETGNRRRLGSVGSQSSERFTLPVSANDLVFEAVPLASNEGHVSDPIRFNPGDQLVWRLENQLTHSTFFKR